MKLSANNLLILVCQLRPPYSSSRVLVHTNVDWKWPLTCQSNCCILIASRHLQQLGLAQRGYLLPGEALDFQKVALKILALRFCSKLTQKASSMTVKLSVCMLRLFTLRFSFLGTGNKSLLETGFPKARTMLYFVICTVHRLKYPERPVGLFTSSTYRYVW